MGSLFFRTYFSVVIFAIVAFLLTVFVIFKPFLLKQEWQDFKEEAVVDHQLVMLKLEQAQPSSWPQIIESHETVFDMELLLITQENLTEQQKKVLSRPGSHKVLSDFEEDIWYALYTLPNSEKILKIHEWDVSLDDLDMDDIFWLVFPLALISLVQLFGVLLLLRKISNPIKALIKTADAFGQGDLARRADIDAPAPINQLSLSFNQMAGRIKQVIHEQKIMIGAIPHELRTPLSRLRFMLDLTRNKKTVSELRDSIEVIDSYVEDLRGAVDEVLELARMQNDQTSISGTVNLSEILLDASKHYQQKNKKNINIVCDEPLLVSGNQGLLRRAIYNLTDNAVHYANNKIELIALIDREDAVVQVDDNGKGIPVEKREEVLALFSRLDESRNRTTGGLGLGLALVNLVMQRHNGKVQVTESPLGGIRLELRWPNII